MADEHERTRPQWRQGAFVMGLVIGLALWLGTDSPAFLAVGVAIGLALQAGGRSEGSR